jgi:uncharacterized membrane protein YczE
MAERYGPNVSGRYRERTLAFVSRLALPDIRFRQFIQLNPGLMVFGVAISLMLRANLGLDPWSVLHEGLAERTGLSFGRVTQLVGVALIAFNFFALRQRPGLGTALNMLLVGPWIDFFGAQPWLPTVPAGAWGWGVAVFTSGVVLSGLAIGLYITARFGAGPRDDLVLGSALRLGRSVRLTRGGLELSVLAAGFLLGGSVGLGTVIFALMIGPVMQFFLCVFHYERLPAATTESAVAPAAGD